MRILEINCSDPIASTPVMDELERLRAIVASMEQTEADLSEVWLVKRIDRPWGQAEYYSTGQMAAAARTNHQDPSKWEVIHYRRATDA